MATITTINSGDLISDSRAVINTNLSNLNSDKIETSYLDTDGTLAANSDVKIATQKAVKTYVDTEVASAVADIPTIGELVDYAGVSVPTNYLECDGSAVSRTTYAALFSVLSTRYGEGNGSTTFNLPRLLNFTAGSEGIFYDNSASESANGTSHTYSYTTAGTNRLLVVSAYVGGGQTISGITYGGVAMTQVTSQVYDTNRTLYTYYLIAPTIGANNVVITTSGTTDIYSTVYSFKNMLQSGVLDTNSKSAATGASFTASITTAVANEILVVSGGFSSAVGMTGEADWTLSVNEGQSLTTMATVDSSASGAKSDIFTMGGSNNYGYIESAFKVNTTALATTYKIIRYV